MRGRAIAEMIAMFALLGSPAAAKAKPKAAPVPSYLPSTAAWQVINWVIATHDNNGMPFLVIDKVAGEVFAFDSTTRMIAGSPALVGMTAGDESSPGVGDRELSNIPPAERTTPAGRFIAKFGRAAGGRDVLWVDYPTAISLHAVIDTNKKQRRPQRLKSPTPDDNRITFGCINVPAQFYSKLVKPLFKGTAGVVYILPETKPLNAVFLAMPVSPGSATPVPAAQ
ncbi:MAG TPA: hypothetical protein VH392_11955 [Sphingomicrobium sp.]|jgi:hypothetical protein